MVGAVGGQGAHVFGQQRPSSGGDFTLHGKQIRDTHYRELPPPTGAAPFRLDIKDVVSAEMYEAITAEKQLTFHLNGDMGGIGNSTPQELVAAGMEADLAVGATPAAHPAFLYLTGDCVYYNGEIDKYYQQFYAPYKFYNAPIFAVPGNHDGENVRGDESLDGFVRNFCAPTPVKQPESGDSLRTAMVQPNVYWTLVTPLVNIVGLYSNVPEGGEIQTPQTEWLVGELRDLPPEVPLLVALHHPPYSADDHHSGSTTMKELIEQAATAAGRHPDLVLAGHVHDYQRLTKQHDDGTQAPFLVTGAGGYPNLHSIRKVDGQRMIPPVQFADDNDPVTLESYSDDHHGFLRVTVTPATLTGQYYVVPRPQDPFSKGNHLVDYFEYDWHTRKYRPNQL
jgi:acid phosphatase type 7